MQITTSKENARVPVTVVHVTGTVDSSNYEQLQARIDEIIQGGAHNLVLDLHGVDYMSSAGMRVLNHAYTALRDRTESDSQAVGRAISAGTYRSAHLKLAGLRPRVHEVLKMGGFDMFLDIHPDIHSALASF
jgi:anti-sigma B factor antagonist